MHHPGLRFIAFGLLLTVLSSPVPAIAQGAQAKSLQHAQKLLSDGQFDESFAEYLRIATEQDNALAMFTVALFHDMGWGRQQDPAKACDWYQRAAERGIPTSSQRFAHCLENGIGRPADLPAAAHWYSTAAEQGIHVALCDLGWLYMRGRGVEKEPVRALQLCGQSAELGAPGSMLQVGRMLAEGDESVRDLDAAGTWFGEAAMRGSVEAAFRYGLMLRDGVGRPAAPDQAIEWLEAAGAEGHVPSYLLVGELYLNAPPDHHTGQPTERNLAKAYLWLTAAERASKDPSSRRKASELLVKVKAIMPQSWAADLNAKVDAHLSAHPPG